MTVKQSKLARLVQRIRALLVRAGPPPPIRATGFFAEDLTFKSPEAERAYLERWEREHGKDRAS